MMLNFEASIGLAATAVDDGLLGRVGFGHHQFSSCFGIGTMGYRQVCIYRRQKERPLLRLSLFGMGDQFQGGISGHGSRLH